MSKTPVEMEDRVGRLFAVLDVDIEHLRNCLSRLGKLRCLVIKRDEAALSKLLEDIRIEAEDYAGNESKRLVLRRELANYFGFEVGRLTLSALENILPADKRARLAARKAALRSLVEQLRNEYISTAVLISDCARINSALLKSILDESRGGLVCYDANGKASRANETAFVNMRL